MANPNEPYIEVVVESYTPSSTAGLHGPVHIRPVRGQPGSKKLSDTSIYPLGTKFKIRAKITDREGGKPFLYSHYSWPFTVIKQGN